MQTFPPSLRFGVARRSATRGGGRSASPGDPDGLHDSPATPANASAAQTQTPPTSETRPAFADWLADVRKEALSRGIQPDIVEAALSNIEEPLPVVLERDRTQAEIVLPLETYLRRRLTARFITAGREAYSRHKTLLESIGKAYGVSPSIIAAIWGVES